MDLKKEHDYFWPDLPLESGFRRYIKRAPDMDKAIAFCKNKRTVVQAGGHCGVWPIRLAGIFEQVYTFEPCQHNFRALMANVRQQNIYAARGVLGSVPGFTGINKNPKNTGGHWVQGAGPGAIPIYTIDQFRFENLDLILLDVEGYEIFALMGGRQTIDKFKPVIMYEDNGNFEIKGGYSRESMEKFMAALGYKQVSSAADDKIWAPR